MRMMTTDHLRAVAYAHKRHADAAVMLRHAVEDALPNPGQRVEIPRGHGTVRGELVRYSGIGGDPFRVYVRLDTTGDVFGLSVFPLFVDAIYGPDR